MTEYCGFNLHWSGKKWTIMTQYGVMFGTGDSVEQCKKMIDDYNN